MFVDNPSDSGLTDGRPAPAVELDGLSVRRGAALVLKNVGLRVPAGAVVAVIGRSGAGKTSLLRAIAGLDRPESGTIRFHGRADRAARPRLGMIFQDHALIGRLSALDNVLLAFAGERPAWSLPFPWSRSRRTSAASALAEVELLDKAAQPAATLSGGERQRVAIARLLAALPQLILADEPLSAIDPMRRLALGRLLVRTARMRGATMLIVLHDLQAALSVADLVVSMKGGEIIACEPPRHFDPAYSEWVYRSEEAERVYARDADRDFLVL
jgi:phosphonate transport system ATP-binding protein